jgi:hypothetical protein
MAPVTRAIFWDIFKSFWGNFGNRSHWQAPEPAPSFGTTCGGASATSLAHYIHCLLNLLQCNTPENIASRIKKRALSGALVTA